MKRLYSAFFIYVCLFFAFHAHAGSALQVAETTLDNGLKLVVIENHRAPVITHMVWFHAGAADEPRGVSGVAHYLEHMMFKGAKGLADGEYSKTVQRYGGSYNAFTGQDYTAYYVSAAAEHIDAIMALEAKRLKHLAPAREAFVNEREVVIEERRMRVENHPSARLKETMRATLFRNHPYRFPIIGWKHEMLGLSYEDVMAFYRRYYRPDNAVIIMAGDITMDKARHLARRHFGDWIQPTDPKPERRWMVEPPRETSEYVTLAGEDISKPQWFRDYISPSIGTEASLKNVMARVVMAELLGGSKSSIMHQDLVVNQTKATSATASYNLFSRGPAVLNIAITPSEETNLQEVEAAYSAMLTSVISEGISDASLERTKNRLKAETIYARDGIENMAFLFGQLVMLGLGEEFFNDWGTYIDAVTEEEVIAVMKEELLYAPSVTGWLLPEGMAK